MAWIFGEDETVVVWRWRWWYEEERMVHAL